MPPPPSDKVLLTSKGLNLKYLAFHKANRLTAAPLNEGMWNDASLFYTVNTLKASPINTACHCFKLHIHWSLSQV